MSIRPIELDEIATRYVAAMTSIRGRRVHRLLMREFRDAECVLEASAEIGEGTALLAIGKAGALAVCRTDGTGSAAQIVELPPRGGVIVTTAFDLRKDSLPIVAWCLWHPGLASTIGALSISSAGFDAAGIAKIARLLKSSSEAT